MKYFLCLMLISAYLNAMDSVYELRVEAQLSLEQIKNLRVDSFLEAYRTEIIRDMDYGLFLYRSDRQKSRDSFRLVKLKTAIFNEVMDVYPQVQEAKLSVEEIDAIVSDLKKNRMHMIFPDTWKELEPKYISAERNSKKALSSIFDMDFQAARRRDRFERISENCAAVKALAAPFAEKTRLFNQLFLLEERIRTVVDERYESRDFSRNPVNFHEIRSRLDDSVRKKDLALSKARDSIWYVSENDLYDLKTELSSIAEKLGQIGYHLFEPLHESALDEAMAAEISRDQIFSGLYPDEHRLFMENYQRFLNWKNTSYSRHDFSTSQIYLERALKIRSHYLSYVDYRRLQLELEKWVASVESDSVHTKRHQKSFLLVSCRNALSDATEAAVAGKPDRYYASLKNALRYRENYEK